MTDDIQLRFRVEDEARVTRAIAAMNAEPLPDATETDTYYRNAMRGVGHGEGVPNILRIREADGRFTLTLKHTETYTSEGWQTPFREFQSVSVGVTDKAAMDEILRAMQFEPVHCYRKTKKSWKAGRCIIELHTFVFGTWLEVKGSREALEGCVRSLGFTIDATDRKGYPDYYEEYCREHRIPIGQLV